MCSHTKNGFSLSNSSLTHIAFPCALLWLTLAFFILIFIVVVVLLFLFSVWECVAFNPTNLIFFYSYHSSCCWQKKNISTLSMTGGECTTYQYTSHIHCIAASQPASHIAIEHVSHSTYCRCRVYALLKSCTRGFGVFSKYMYAAVFYMWVRGWQLSIFDSFWVR